MCRPLILCNLILHAHILTISCFIVTFLFEGISKIRQRSSRGAHHLKNKLFSYCRHHFACASFLCCDSVAGLKHAHLAVFLLLQVFYATGHTSTIKKKIPFFPIMQHKCKQYKQTETALSAFCFSELHHHLCFSALAHKTNSDMHHMCFFFIFMAL